MEKPHLAHRDSSISIPPGTQASREIKSLLYLQLPVKKAQGMTDQENDPLLADSDEKASLRPRESVYNKVIR